MAVGGGEAARDVYLARAERIGTLVLIRGAIRRLADVWLPMVLLWIVAGAVLLLVRLGVTAVDEAALQQSLKPAYLAYAVLTTATTASAATFGYRILLRERGDWLRLDRGFFECAGLVALGNVAFDGASDVGRLFVAPTWGATYALISVLLLALASLYLGSKLVLWPIDRVMGRSNVGPTQSWRLMRGATLSYLLAQFIMLIPSVLVAAGWTTNALLSGGGRTAGSTGGVLEFSVGGGLVLCAAVSATAYELRVGAPATVADVFA